MQHVSATLLSCLCTLGFIVNLSDYIENKNRYTLYLAWFNLACVLVAAMEMFYNRCSCS